MGVTGVRAGGAPLLSACDFSASAAKLKQASPQVIPEEAGLVKRCLQLFSIPVSPVGAPRHRRCGQGSGGARPGSGRMALASAPVGAPSRHRCLSTLRKSIPSKRSSVRLRLAAGDEVTGLPVSVSGAHIAVRVEGVRRRTSAEACASMKAAARHLRVSRPRRSGLEDWTRVRVGPSSVDQRACASRLGAGPSLAAASAPLRFRPRVVRLLRGTCSGPWWR